DEQHFGTASSSATNPGRSDLDNHLRFYQRNWYPYPY
ncbi:hypothetical protein MTO96_043781, partial [Rhipicephalus appendiculatus]